MIALAFAVGALWGGLVVGLYALRKVREIARAHDIAYADWLAANQCLCHVIRYEMTREENRALLSQYLVSSALSGRRIERA